MMNRRRYERVPLRATATLKVNADQDSKVIQTMVADISLSGIGVYSDNPMREDSDLLIDITFISPDGFIRTDSIGGNTVYSRQMGDLYFIGIEFEQEIDPTKQPFLFEHLRRTLSHK